MALGKTSGGRKNPSDLIISLIIRSLFTLALLLPYRLRVPCSGWIVANIISPLAGYSKRIKENLFYVMPDLPKGDVNRLVKQVPNNAGRTLIEIFSGEEFICRAENAEIIGGGLKELERAQKENQPVILVTGHFGNYDVARAALTRRGHIVGALYREMNNGYFNNWYEKAISKIGTPIFPRGRKGLSELIKFLRNGGIAGFLIDQHMRDGAPLTYFGKTALTGLSAADLALKYNAILVPVYGLRLPNGLDFKIICEEPITHSTSEKMTQELNDSLEAIVKQNMGQWFWVHRRWKPDDKTRDSA
jgi:KDO2-lipid IV(A) lauroyltransferase